MGYSSLTGPYYFIFMLAREISTTVCAGFSVVGPFPVLNSNGSMYPKVPEAGVCGVIGGISK